MKKEVAFSTLGCKANQYDAEIMKDAFRTEPGYEIVPFSEDPDAVVINTCSVTSGADRKSRKYIRRAARKADLVMVTGCYTTLDSDEIADISGVDVIFPNSHKYNVIEVMDRAESGFRGKLEKSGSSSWDLDEQVISRDSNHTRAFLKIQDGCSNECSFCKVRFLRGPTRSKSRSMVREEVEKLGGEGFSEIVLTGINLAEYGEDDDELANLIRELSEVEDITRVRLSSINPDGITRKLLEVFEDSGKICPYFHVPLQSGSDKILDAMKRGYSRKDYLNKVNLIRKYLPDATFGTDLMVGFPGEQEDDFVRTKKTLREVGFINVHVFRYSPRSVTPAGDFEDKVDGSKKKERAKELRSLGSTVSLATRSQFKGNILDMIVEESSDKIDGWRGYSRRYLDVHVPYNESTEDLVSGSTVRVRLSEVKEDYCLGEPVNSNLDGNKVSKQRVRAGKGKTKE